MDDKLLRFFNEIKLDNEYFKYFEGSKIDKVEVNAKKKYWIISISLHNLIDVEIYEKLCEYSKNIKKINNVYFKFSFKDDGDLLSNYFWYIFNKLVNEYPMLESIKNNNIDIEKNLIKVELHNKIEFDKFNKIVPKIKDFLDTIGFNINIETYINEEARAEIKKIIENTAEIKVFEKKEDPIIYGNDIKGEIFKIKNIIAEENDVILEAYIFDMEIKQTNSKYTIFTLKISDNTDSIIAKLFLSNEEDIKRLSERLKTNKWYKFRGYIKHDSYINDLSFNIRDIVAIEKQENKRTDNAEEKRVELHLHTMFSQMDGLIDIDPKKNLLFKKINDFGHKAVGITDKNTVQAFPKLYKSKKDIKVLFGAEVFVVEDEVKIITKESSEPLNSTFVVFDFETTGLNAFGGDSIIEIGAVKIKEGKIIDKFSELINPKIKLREIIKKVTKITDSMLKDKDDEETVIKRFMDWVGDLPMVAHNASFDLSFVKSAFVKYNMGEVKNTIIDTLELSRAIDSDIRTHSLSALVKRYEVPFDEDAHHRADYDAEATAYVFHKLISRLDNSFKTVKDLNNLINIDHIVKTSRPFHVTLFAKNNVGLKNLFKIISYANTKYFYKTPRILRSELSKLREGIIIGSGCASGEIFEAAKNKSNEDLINLMMFYDFIEVNPPSILEHLIENDDFANNYELEENIKKIINSADSIGKLVCATGDVHTLEPEDNIYRKIIVAQKQPGGGLHPLNKPEIKTIPNAYFRTTEEMLNDFAFLGEEKAKEIVVTNTNKIADMIEDVEVLKKELFTPKMENSAQILRDIVYTNAKKIYGENLPEIIVETLEKELNGIIGNGYDVIYLISQKIIEKSMNDGYLVGSRGSVGSSLVATFCNITEVNPLPEHYVCPNCKKSIFEIDGKPLSETYNSGFDLPDKKCECGAMFLKNGQNIPFSSFLGYNADKVPDIDLNISSEYQAKAHEYTKELLGEKSVFRAGTVSTVAEKTAYGFVKGYMEEKGITLRKPEIERLAKGITNVKRTTGQHPGGIVVIPDDKEVTDFTPYQYPAEKTDSQWYTTHFEYHDIEDNVIKLDLLGHDDPTMLKYLLDEVKIDVNELPMADPKVLSLFSSPEVLGVTEEDIMCPTGTIGLPEFGTNFVIKMLEEIKPKNFAELLKVSGLSHGIGIWAGNGRELLMSGKAKFDEIIGCREEVISMLANFGIDYSMAFKITEYIRKSYRPQSAKLKDERFLPLHEELLKIKDVAPEWFIDHCETIEYLFPKSHATAYVTMAVRVAWFKVYYPIEYYKVYLSVRKDAFDIESMIKGKKAIKAKMQEIMDKGFEASNKEVDILDTLKSALEMVCRGFYFENISLTESDATMFKITKDKKGLIPPFTTIDGLGETAAKKIVEERNKSPFVSIEDLQNRGKVSATIIDKLKEMGVLEGLPESSQLSLF